MYLFMRDTHTEGEAETQAEGEAGPMQGTRCGTRSRVSRITPQATGSPSGAAVWRLPSAQGVILETRDRIPRRAPCMEPASPSACVSASLSAFL